MIIRQRSRLILGRLLLAHARRHTLNDSRWIRADKIRDRVTFAGRPGRTIETIRKRRQHHSVVGGFELVCFTIIQLAIGPFEEEG